MSLCLAGLVSPYVSRLPDGLERVSNRLGIGATQETSESKRTDSSQTVDQNFRWRSILGRLPGPVVAVFGTILVFGVAVLLARTLAALTPKPGAGK